MSHSSYTASERRGILAIAIISLLLVGAGVGLSFLGNQAYAEEETPMVIEHPEMIDSTAVLNTKKLKSETKKSPKNTKQTSTKTKKSSSKTKSKKTYRRRSPLDEPV